jgi:sulfhydrogenase subunit delta
MEDSKIKNSKAGILDGIAVEIKTGSAEFAKNIAPKGEAVPGEEKRMIFEGKKPKVAIVSLTSCEGCQFALLDLGQRFFDFVNQVEMVDFRLIEDEEDPGMDLDLVLVEGNPVTDDNVELLKQARKRARILAALGNCAAMGGIPEIKNYQEGANTIKHVYKYLQGISNPEIKEIDNFVPVDFIFPGCPINAEEFLKYIPELIRGKIPVIPDQPVCVECKKKGNRCLLLDKNPCFGPMILGGCDAVCPTAKMVCQGCRGLRPTGNVKAMRMTLKNMMTDEEFENTAEIYGLRDDIEEKSNSL